MTEAAFGDFDLHRLEGWMDDHGIGAGAISAPEHLPGGTQHLMVRFTRGDAAYVLRRGRSPVGTEADRTIAREVRVLAALHRTTVPHPRLIGAESDRGVVGGAFYLMEAVEGINATRELSPFHRSEAHVRRVMGLSATDALAAIGEVDVVALGLSDLGNPEGFLERQVPRWSALLASYAGYDGYVCDLPDLDRVVGWLVAHRPVRFRAGLQHGDYHLGNVLFAPAGPEVVAVVDWEMVTVGDPLLDLGWYLVAWPGTGGAEIGGPIAEAGGLPGPDEVVSRYGSRSTLGLDDLAWYQILACFKYAVVIEGTYARACSGLASVRIGDHLHRMAVALIRRAHALLDEQR